MNVLTAISAAALLAASSGGAVPAASRPASAPAARAASRAVLPWIEDDYARAIAEGKRRGLPVFVEAWAPW